KLDRLDGDHLDEKELLYRGRLAYELWNFSLAEKYLKPIAFNNIKNAYAYGRTLYFLDRYDEARTAFQTALSTWPSDPVAKQCLMQYAGMMLRTGQHQKAEELYRRLSGVVAGKERETVAYKLAEALRAQRRYDDAVTLLRPYLSGRSPAERDRAVFVRARIDYQE